MINTGVLARTLFLHVGQPKTGTTHLQAVFAANRSRLAEAGLHYPIYGDDARVVDLHKMVPCGNGRRVLSDRDAFERALVATGSADRVLFSSELMFNHICEGDGIGWLPEVARAHGFVNTRVLCLLRDPLPFAVSEWQQRVKGDGGETRTLDEYVRGGFDGPARTLRVLDRVSSLGPMVDATWRRYETVVASPEGLEGAVAAWLDLTLDSLAIRPPAVLNRSMTRSEVELQRQLNIRLGRCGELFAFPVTVDVSEVPSDPSEASRRAIRSVVAQVCADVEAINCWLAPEDQLRLPSSEIEETVPASSTAPTYSFTSEQLAVLAAAIGERLNSNRPWARAGSGSRPVLRVTASRIRRSFRTLAARARGSRYYPWHPRRLS